MAEGNGVTYTTKELIQELRGEVRTEFREIKTRLTALENQKVAEAAVRRYRRGLSAVLITLLASGVGALVSAVIR